MSEVGSSSEANSLGAGPQGLSVGACATLACVWEATAPKPGNVYRGADFEDLTYVDFLTSAAIIGPVLEHTATRGVGATILEAVQSTRAAVATNTNLGMMLLMTPLAAVDRSTKPSLGISQVLRTLNADDTQQVYEAIRVAQPGGLGKSETADVNDPQQPTISLLEAMQLAAERDLVARQYNNDFQQVFQVAGWIEAGTNRDWAVSDAIVHAYLQLLSEFPDSLIARKCGEPIAKQVSTQAAKVLSQGEPTEEAYQLALAEFDFSLRVDGHQRNPGTSADLVAAALFVLLREDRVSWPVKFYRGQEVKGD